MLMRYPYWGLLLLSLLLWCMTGYHFHTHNSAMQPGNMAQFINRDLQRRESQRNAFLKQQNLIQRLFTDSLSAPEEEKFRAFPFYIYCYDHDSLRLWNTNTVIADNDTVSAQPRLIKNAKGVFIQEALHPAYLRPSQRLVILFPVLITYPQENDYLRSHFAAADYIPVSTRIAGAVNATEKGYPVAMHDKTLFYLHFNPQDIPRWTPDPMFVLLLIASLLALISWVHLVFIHLTRHRSATGGFLLTLGVIIVLRSLLYIYGLPFNLGMLLFFSPSLYASSKYLSSFGDLYINVLCVLWLVIFVTRHTPYKQYLEGVRNRWLRYALVPVLTTFMIGYLFLFVHLISSLVLDSNISFDVSHFYAINFYTTLGLMLIGIISGISFVIIYLFNVQLVALLPLRVARYAVVAVISLVVLSLYGYAHTDVYLLTCATLVVLMAFLDHPKLSLTSDLLAPHMIFWAIFIGALTTAVLQYFNDKKEQDARKVFVEQKLSPHRDNLMEYTFDKTIGKIERDPQLKAFFSHPGLASRKQINQRFDSLYLSGPVIKYKTTLYLFDENGNGLYNTDSTGFEEMEDEKNESATTNSPYLFYKESILDRHFYLSYIRIYSDTINKLIGYVIVDMDLKKQATETVYPELLQPASNKTNPSENEYAYAVYMNDKLITQTNEYPFPTALRVDTLPEQHYIFTTEYGASELYYKISNKRTIVVVHHHILWLETITVFSYIFVIQVALAIILLLYQFILAYFSRAPFSEKLLRLTLRSRVHYSMLLVVLLSFIIIGSVTVAFFTNQYRNSSKTKLLSAMNTAKMNVQDYIKNKNGFDTDLGFDSVCQSAGFKSYIADMANNQKIDINVYDALGRLFATSQEDIYEKGLISRVMRPDAFYQLNIEGMSILVQNERVAGLSYLAAYEPLRDEHGITLGYINVPFFSSEKELNSQISNIVVTLINLYAFIFLVSSIITVFITRWITKSFNLISQQFSRLNLQQNERIQWAYDDEIGVLVKEYNKMVNKVEENAARLAQSERETAWREMARQVAHEIKNPLTPMKLSIQYLQQAMRNDNPNIKELTNRVADSIVEQINNLSYIASEFSNFAKMPEARPEVLDLTTLLHKAAELYLNEQRIRLSITGADSTVLINSDRSQLLRVFTNLLENAKQAIPEDRDGIVNITATIQDGHVLIAIADNGTGISEEAARHIFQPYFTTKSSGTGLGLAMTRKIIEFWKGSIWFDTEEGHGTTFFIKLPVYSGEESE